MIKNKLEPVESGDVFDKDGTLWQVITVDRSGSGFRDPLVVLLRTEGDMIVRWGEATKLSDLDKYLRTTQHGVFKFIGKRNISYPTPEREIPPPMPLKDAVWNLITNSVIAADSYIVTKEAWDVLRASYDEYSLEEI